MGNFLGGWECLYYLGTFAVTGASMSRGKVTVEIFTAGDGINYPKPGQTVTIHYIGYLVDGSQWDSSRDRGKPFKFKLGAEQVVQGLDEGVSQLSIGERAKLIIPPNLGYGAKGFPGLIPPNSTLIFDVELITFN
jgi:FK506-binding protein 1